MISGFPDEKWEELFFIANNRVRLMLDREDCLISELKEASGGDYTFCNDSISKMLIKKYYQIPCIEVHLNILNSLDKKIGYYHLNLDLDKDFIDEYFVIN